MRHMDAVDVANFFVEMSNADEDGCMTNLKLNKLVYFAQAWSLAKLGKPLFEEEVQAQSYGPVIPSVYSTFSTYGRDRISETAGKYDESKYSEEVRDLLLDVTEKYWSYSAWGLRDLTHKKGGAWSQTYSETRTNAIPKDLIKEDVKDDHLDSFNDHIDEIVAKIPVEGYRNEKGQLVLPADPYPDWDDDYDRC